MSPRRQTRASVGSTLESPKQTLSGVTSPRTRSCNKIILRSIPSSSKNRKSLNESPLRRHVSIDPIAKSPSKKNLSNSNSPRCQEQKITEISPKKILQAQVASKTPVLKSPKKSTAVLSTSPAQLRSTRGKPFGNTQCSDIEKAEAKPLKNLRAKPLLDSSVKSPSKSLSKASSKSPLKSPLKSLTKSPTKSRMSRTSILKSPPKCSSKSPLKSDSPKKSPVKSPSKSPVKSPSKSPVKATRSQLSPCKAPAGPSPSRQSAQSRKRLLASPPKSPRSAKIRRLRGNIISLDKAMNESEADEGCKPLDNSIKDINAMKTSFSHVSKKQFLATNTLPTDPALTGRFLRRKWFSLKTRGGFTCLRSAILSPEEITQEVLQATMIDKPQVEDANFFTTKLMMRLSSRLPPTRARPSCEELVDLIKSKQNEKKFDALTEAKGESTAIRVKLEKRSYPDTISHVNTRPSKAIGDTSCTSKRGVQVGAGKDQESSLTKKREREIALLQLKNLRYW